MDIKQAISGLMGGQQPKEGMEEQIAQQQLIEPAGAPRITDKDVAKAQGILQQYKSGKANLEHRIIEDELWWELRHQEVIRRAKGGKKDEPVPTSAWLFNSIVSKHADAMDNIPEANVLPREPDDEESAKVLSSVLPTIMEYNGFEDTYDDAWWEKLKHGAAAYMVTWDSSKDNGLGDIAIKQVDLLNIFWEPGVSNIQDSRNLFITSLVDEDLLNQQYPQFNGKLAGDAIDVAQYIYDDAVDVSGKVVVVDWYYKVKAPSGRTLVHFAKFAGGHLLYATENQPDLRDSGLYDHGKYPVVMDQLYPEKGSPAGFGLVSVCRDPQYYIDKLSGNILTMSMQATKRRYFKSGDAGVNEEELLDWDKPIVHMEGVIDDSRFREMQMRSVDPIYANILEMKVNEMKETASNRDVNNGGSGSGVTAAAAISAIQEAGNKTSRDMISSSYRAYQNIVWMVLELIRQFYDESRAFRIIGPDAAYQFIQLSNAKLKDQQIGQMEDGTPLYRKPIFDLKIKAQRKNPFSRAAQNELAKEFYAMGFFDPNRAQESVTAIEMMDFEGKQQLLDKIKQGQTLLNVVQQMSAQMDQMATIIQATTGMDMGIGQNPAQPGAKPANPADTGKGDGINGAQARAQAPMTDYGQRLAAAAGPKMGMASKAAAPQ